MTEIVTSEPILLLRLEHEHADELLGILAQQLEPGTDLDLELLGNIATYFQDYPDQCHHPVEDRIFRELQRRAPVRAAEIGQLLEEHAYIGEMTEAFAQAIIDSATDRQLREQRLPDITRHFIDRYRAHMRAEETSFFPAALATLTPEDWAEVEYDLFDRPDPLFEAQTELSYQSLRERIAKLALRSGRRASTLRKVGRLRALEGADDFNSLMRELGRPETLVAFPNGSYGLQSGHETLVDIPLCEPARAAWCAFYFLEALDGPRHRNSGAPGR